MACRHFTRLVRTLRRGKSIPPKPDPDKLLTSGIAQIHNYQLSAAVQTLHQALELFQQVQDHPGVVSALTNLGVAYRNLKQPDQAIECYQQALTLGRKIGAQPFFMASTLNNLGISYGAKNEFQHALACFQKALPLYQQIRDRRGEANVLCNLGHSYHHLNHSQQASLLCQQAIRIAQSIKDHDLEASIQHFMASVDIHLTENPQDETDVGANRPPEDPHQTPPESGNTIETETSKEPDQKEAALWVQSQETQLRQQGAEDNDVLDHFNDLAETCCLEGKNLEAEAIWMRVLEILQQTHGENNLASGLLLRRLAAFYRSQERYAEAEAMIKRSLSIFQQLFDNRHPSVGVSFDDLAALYHCQGRYREAEAFYLKAIPILRAIGDDHPDTQNALKNFQQLLQQARQENRLEELSDDPFTKTALEQGVLGIPSNPRKKSLIVKPQDMSEILWVNTLENQLRKQTSDPIRIVQGLNNAAEICREKRDDLKAEALWLRAITLYEQHHISDDSNLAVIFNNLASFYRSQSRYAESEPFFLEAISIVNHTLGEHHPATNTIWQNFTLFVEQVMHENRLAELSDHQITQTIVQAVGSQVK